MYNINCQTACQIGGSEDLRIFASYFLTLLVFQMVAISEQKFFHGWMGKRQIGHQ